MEITKYDEQISISDQIRINDIDKIYKLGYKTIICNRPDNEEENQPTINNITEAAKKYNIDVHYLPITSIDFDLSIAIAIACQAILTSAGKTIIYCRSGKRSSIVWGIVKINEKKDIKSILGTLKKNGHYSEKIRKIISKI